MYSSSRGQGRLGRIGVIEGGENVCEKNATSCECIRFTIPLPKVKSAAGTRCVAAVINLCVEQ